MNTPWHIRVVGALSLLWNAGGAYDYVMTQTGNASYLAMLTEPQRAFMANVPTWFEAAWATGVWCAVLGSLLILLRSRFAAPAFLVSLLGLLAASLYTFALADPPATHVMGGFALVFSAAICASLILLLIYARKMAACGYLR